MLNNTKNSDRSQKPVYMLLSLKLRENGSTDVLKS